MSERIYNKMATPPTQPAAGKATEWVGTDGRKYMKDGDTGQTTTQSVVGLNRNYLVNGGHFLAQRQAPATLTTYNTATGRLYAADRWGITNQTASAQYQRVDTLGGIEAGLTARYYGRYKQITAAGKIVVSQVVEGVTSAVLRGGICRVQVKMRRTVAASMTVRLGLAQLTAAGTIDTIPATFISAFGGTGVDNTLGTNLSYITPIANTAENGAISGSGVTCILSSGWLRYSFCFIAPIDCKNLIVMVWTDGQLAINDELNIAEAGVYDGADAQDWVELPIADEFSSCQRFCHKTGDVDVLMAQSMGLTGALRGYVSVAAAVAAQPIGVRYPVPMRAAPTFTFYNPSAANAFVRNTTAGSDATATAAANVGNQGCDVQFTGIAAWTVAQAVAVQYLATAEI